MSNNKNKESYFWVSYSDLMTSLFFVMLVLFVLVIVLLHNKVVEVENEKSRAEEAYRATQAQVDKINEIQKSVENINQAYFSYNERYKKHIFKLEVRYRVGDFDIRNITDQSLLGGIVEAGRDIQDIIQKFSREDNIQYLVVVEGQASKDNYHIDDYHNNNVLSYLRALKLKEFWELHGIELDKFENCEILVSGSGEGGVPRNYINEKDNQRFLIHIIPKTGIIGNN